ncbi:hypothetical protein MPSEU_001020100 [Mayamaea pseudoterrestris]|nr:hypothetical protein MPSEU_001020100 [Mayamaea pseudoterrestris]
MLGPDRFAFETPNVIDPGDAPPSQPVRPDQPVGDDMGMNGNGGSSTTSRNQDDASQKTVPTSNRYHDERSVRLLRDIADLDLSPPTEPYDPYRDDRGDDDDLEGGAESSSSKHHSLPTVDDARMYAASLLQESSGRSGGRDFQRTVKLRMPKMPVLTSSSRASVAKTAIPPVSEAPYNPHRHLLRRQVMRQARKVCAVIVVVVVVVVIAVTVHNKRRGDAAPSLTTATSTADGSFFNLRSQIKGVDTKKRKQDIIAFLIDQTVTSHYDLDDADTPQSKAVDWLAQYDLLVRPVPTKLHSRQRFVQRYALATLYYALSGQQWTKNHKFLSSEDECGWFDEAPVNDYVSQTAAFGVTCDTNLAVQSLYVPDNNLQGSLPSELRFLSNLDMIALPNNAIRGTIPRELRSWSNLVYIDLKYNRISGMLPSWIGDLSNLEVLGLSNNEFAGGVPPNFGSLGRLKTLALDDNALTGDLEWVNHLTKLQYFYGERNSFTGQVNDNFLSELSSLKELDLSSTALLGDDFPLHLLKHPSLEILDLSHTQLKGSLPVIPSMNNVLQFLSLRHCNISGTIPPSLQQLQGLEHLDLTENAFGGTIPNVLGRLTNLKFLFLGRNNFDAMSEMPPLFSQLTDLRELSLESSNLSGRIPSWISYLEYLKLLNLSCNNMDGTIPPAIWDLPELTFVMLHDNQLSGEIPSDIQGAGKMQVLSLFNNSLTGDITYFCDANPDFSFIAPDCTVTCDTSCCEKCCKADEKECFRSELPMYLTEYEGAWEYGFDRASYSFDPDILENSEGDQGGMPETIIGDNFQYPVDQKPNEYLPDPFDPTVTMENFTVPTNGGGTP